MVEMSQLLRDGQPKAGGIVLGVGPVVVKIAVEHGLFDLPARCRTRCPALSPGRLRLPRAGHCDHTARRGIVDGVGNEVLHHLL